MQWLIREEARDYTVPGYPLTRRREVKTRHRAGANGLLDTAADEDADVTTFQSRYQVMT